MFRPLLVSNCFSRPLLERPVCDRCSLWSIGPSCFWKLSFALGLGCSCLSAPTLILFEGTLQVSSQFPVLFFLLLFAFDRPFFAVDDLLGARLLFPPWGGESWVAVCLGRSPRCFPVKNTRHLRPRNIGFHRWRVSRLCASLPGNHRSVQVPSNRVQHLRNPPHV